VRRPAALINAKCECVAFAKSGVHAISFPSMKRRRASPRTCQFRKGAVNYRGRERGGGLAGGTTVLIAPGNSVMHAALFLLQLFMVLLD